MLSNIFKMCDFLFYITRDIICIVANVNFFKLTLVITPGSLNSNPDHSWNSLMFHGSIYIYFFFQSPSYVWGTGSMVLKLSVLNYHGVCQRILRLLRHFWLKVTIFSIGALLSAIFYIIFVSQNSPPRTPCLGKKYLNNIQV